MKSARAPWWTVASSVAAMAAVVATGLPASAEPSPSPSPEPTVEATPEPVTPTAGPHELPDLLQGDAGRADAPALVVDGEQPVVTDADQDVLSQPIPAPADVQGAEAAGTFEAAPVVLPEPTEADVTVEPASILDQATAARAQQPASGDIVVGLGVAPLRDLAAAVYGDDTALASGRPDQVAAALPRATQGAPATVAVTPQLVDGAIPGAAFSAEVTLDESFGPQWVEAAFDTSGFANAYGGDYGDRLQLVALPECALTTPDDPACLVAVPLETEHVGDGILRAFVPSEGLGLIDIAGRTGATHFINLGTGELLSQLPAATGLATAAPSGRTILAAVSGADSQAGSFKATDLAPRGTWGVTEPAGGFTYDIPIVLPPTSTGDAPSVALTYSSQSTDGKTAASNSQSGIIGEGWSMPVSYIERLYKPCSDDGLGSLAELCWDSPYSGVPAEAAYVLSLQGSAQELVYVSSTTTSATYRSVSDPTLKVTRYFGTAGRAGNGDGAGGTATDTGEYFKVETNDGSVFYFGFNPGGSANPSNSVAWEPVWANNAGEPGFASNNVQANQQGYRFYLDLSVDTVGNASTFFYQQATNKYTETNAGRTLTYVRDTQLAKVEYGQTFDAGTSTVTAAEAKVEFSLVKRCVEGGQFYDSLSTGVDVNTLCGDPSPATATSYPDVPVDLICTGTSCNSLQTAPVYFSTVRLDRINTFARDAANAWAPVESTQLVTAFPTTADGSARSLWLDGVYTKGWGNPSVASDNLTTYVTKFSGVRLNNRVDWDLTVGPTEIPQRPLDRLRISNVFTDLGGRIDVTYAQNGNAATLNGSLSSQTCPQGGKDAAAYTTWATTNTLAKINSAANDQLCYAVKQGADTAIYHNYVVTKVELKDLVGGQPTETHTYQYGGSPTFARAESLLYAVGGTGDTSTFSSYHGFLTVTSWVGNGTESTKTTNQYFRGTGATLTSLHDGTSRPDTDPRLQGLLESSKTVDGSGAVIGTSKQTYAVTAIGSTPSWDRTGVTAEHNPYVVQTTAQASTAKDGAWSATTTTSTTYSATNYQPTQVSTVVLDNVTLQSKTQCQAIDYASSSTKNLVLPVGARSFDGTCAAGTMTSKVEVGYDNLTPGSTTVSPTAGLVTEERSYDTATTYTTTKASYDAKGRILGAWLPNDISNTTPSVQWAYGTDGALWTTTVTRALGATSTTYVERGHGNVVKTHGATAGDWTHYQYDALGLLSAGWAPAQWGQASTPSLTSHIPTVQYRYDVYAGAPGAITGPTLRSTPAVITTAPFVADDGGTFPSNVLTSTSRRSVTFLDGFGRAIEQQSVSPDGSGGRTVTATRYNSLGQVDWSSAPFTATGTLRVLSPAGATMLVNPSLAALPTATDYTYDTRGRTTQVASLANGSPLLVGGIQVKSTTSYAGLTTTDTAANGATTATKIDLLGRTISKVISVDSAHPGQPAQTTTYAYRTLTTVGKVGFQEVDVTDPDGWSTVFEANLAGQRTAMQDPNSGTSSYLYDANGQTRSVTSPAGTITLVYDALGRLKERTAADAHGASSSATWDYVDPGEPGAATDLGLLRSATSVTHAWLANLTTVQSTQYDALHRPVSTTTVLPTSPAGYPHLLGELSGQSITTTVAYDAIGQPVTGGLPAVGGLPAETVTTGYRASGLAQTFKVTSGGVTTPLVTGVTYSGTGQLTSRTYGNGVTRAYTWDPATRALTGLSASFVTNESGSAQTVFVQKDSFTRDVMGRITQSTNEVPVLVDPDGAGSAPAVAHLTAECFRYDGFNRLATALSVSSASAPSCGTSEWFWGGHASSDLSSTAYLESMSYSPGGKVLGSYKVGLTYYGSDGGDYEYGDLNHPSAVTSIETDHGILAFAYDDAGRLVESDTAGSFDWDVLNQLTETRTISGTTLYAYDASGQRVVQARLEDSNGAGGTATAYTAAGQLDDANTAATSTGDVTGTRYYTFDGSTVAVRTATGLSLMFGDEQGSTSVVMPVTVQTDGNGITGHLASATLADAANVTRTSYTPFGELRGADNLALDRGWLGQVEDRVDGASGTGLTYLNARYYDPATMRFISPDPLLNPADPKTLDPYRYADNNPVVFTDASGLEAVCAHLADSAAMTACNHTESKGVNSWRTTRRAKERYASAGQGHAAPASAGHGFLDFDSDFWDYGDSVPSLGGHQSNTGYLYFGHPENQPMNGLYGADGTKAETWKTLGGAGLVIGTVAVCRWALAECLAAIGIDGEALGLRTTALKAETGAVGTEVLSAEVAATAGRVNLQGDELLGGHTIAKHVGMSDQALVDRNIDIASTFRNLSSAEDATAANISANADQISSWMTGSNPRLVIDSEYLSIDGRAYLREQQVFTEHLTGVTTVLQRSGDGYYVLTSYPRP